MKKCFTCGLPLWIAWILFGMPWEKRMKSYKEAIDCIDLLPKNSLTSRSTWLAPSTLLLLRKSQGGASQVNSSLSAINERHKGIKMMKEESITGIDRPSDKELLRRAIIYARAPIGTKDLPRWSCVGRVFGVGSTTATILCHEAGIDPNEYMSTPPCEECPYDENGNEKEEE